MAHTAGFISYTLLWFTVIWGMMLGRGWAMTRFKHSNLYATHMTLALIAMTLGWGHAFIQLANPIGTVHLIDEFVPFANGRDPIGIGVGVIATEIMTALLISIPLQKKLGYSRWRALHSLAYASFTLLAGHVLLSGSHVGPLFVKVPVLLMWLSTVVLWLGVSNWALKQKREVTDRAINRLRGQTAEVAVDAAKCARFGFCEQEAPAIFELRADGRLGYKSTIPPEDIEAVSRAVKVCPARAIRMNRAGSRVYMPKNEIVETSGERPQETLANVTGLHRRGGK
ncbi:ferredoxin [Planosporangium sp. 12N6]|uniref:ferredoxin n=1 Tax=Planosporangium spinosum TaxID=3402278 RepID=UPI003CF58B14